MTLGHTPHRRLSGSWLLFFLALAFGFWGVRPLWGPDEGRYGEAAREMVVNGDWLVPRLQQEPHLTKPPLTYWLAALGLRLFGTSAQQPLGSAWGARLCVAAAYFGAILCTVGLAACWGWSRRASLAAGLIFASALLPFASGHILTTDMLLTFWETLGICCAWQVWRGTGRVGIWRRGFWLAFGLAFLTKGPPGWLPLLALVAFCRLRPSFRPRARLWSWSGLAVMLVVALWWFVVVIALMPGTFDHFVGDEIFRRVAGGTHDREKAFYFYLIVVVFGLTPWIFLWPAFVVRLWRKLKPDGAPDPAEPRRWTRTLGLYRDRIQRLDDPAFFSLLWFGLPMIVFQLSSSKMYLYMVPLFVPLALWMGRLYIAIFPDWQPAGRPARLAARIAAALWLCAMIAFVVFPDGVRFARSYRTLAEQVQRHLPPGEDSICVYGSSPHSISFYSGVYLYRPAGISKGKLMRYLRSQAAGRTVLLLTKAKGLKVMEETNTTGEILAHQKDRILVRIDPE